MVRGEWSGRLRALSEVLGAAICGRRAKKGAAAAAAQARRSHAACESDCAARDAGPAWHAVRTGHLSPCFPPPRLTHSLHGDAVSRQQRLRRSGGGGVPAQALGRRAGRRHGPQPAQVGCVAARRLMLRAPGLTSNDRTARGADGQAAGRRRIVGRVAGHGQARRQ